MGGVLLPTALAALLISGRAIATDQRAPYPYELVSAAVIFGLCGLLASANEPLGTAVAYGYLVALTVSPKTANFITKAAGGVQSTSSNF